VDATRPAIVLGYGNTLRGDDAVGPRAAEIILGWGLPGVTALALAQLTPELAEPIATARLAIFVDARIVGDEDPSEVEVQHLEPRQGVPLFGHSGDPCGLLAMALDLFGSCPDAWLVTIPSTDFGLGEELSGRACRRLEDALRRIESLLG
jgi:hydrogenase maturation protease